MPTGSPIQLPGGTGANQRAYPLSGFVMEPDGGDPTFVPIDIVKAYEVTHRMEYTEFPVSKGFIASDHGILQQDVVEIELNVTNTPILDSMDGYEFKTLEISPRPSEFVPGGFLALTSAVTAVIGAAASALGLASPQTIKIKTLQGPGKGGTDRIGKAYELLQMAWYNRFPCTFYANGRVWEGLRIEQLSHPREDAAELGVFRLTCRKLQVVTTGVAALNLNPADGRSSATANSGTRPPDYKPELKSILASGVDAGILPNPL